MTDTETIKSLTGVVGVAASSGGATAVRSLLSGLPAHSGLALLVPSEGGIADLFPASGPSHAFLRVLGDALLTPDRVFVSAGGMAVAGNQLRRTDVRAGMSLDLLFRSLSESCGDRAMAVVLSGAGSDGTVGIAAVHERGGMVLVQEPAEAAWGSMPRSAIRSGLVDRVLPVAQMPEHLLRFARCAPRALAERDLPQLERILQEVERATGGDLSRYDPSLLLGRIRRRMRLHGLEDLAHYARRVVEQGEEARLLVAEVLLTVTRFFRDPAVYRTLADEVVPKMLARHPPDRPVRVWSIGCGTGEEAWSIAMVLRERSSDHPVAVEVVATDLHEAALQRARDGVYPAGIALDIDPDRLARFFVRVDQGWEVGAELRQSVRFVRHDVLSQPPPPADLILCRSLLSSLAPVRRAEVVRRLHGALNVDGVLVLGVTEAPDPPDLFRPIGGAGDPGGLFRRTDVPSAPPPLANRDRRTLRSLSGELRETRQRASEAASGVLATGDAELLRAVFAASAAQLELDACFCHFLNESLDLVAQTGLPDAAVAVLRRLPVVGSSLGRAVITRHLVRIDRLADETEPVARALSGLGLGALVCLPVTIDDRVVATVAFGVRDPARLGPRALAWLATVADLVAAGRRRQVAEAALLARVDAERATNEQVLQQLPSGVLLADATTGEVVFANLAAEQMLGDELPGSSRDLSSWCPYHADGRPYTASELPLVRALQGDVVSGEQMLLLRRTPAGEPSRMFLHVNAAPVRDASGAMKFAILACADLTQQKRAEVALRELAATLEAKVDERTAELRRTEGRFRALIDASAQIVWSADGQGAMVEDSPSWRAFTGQTLDAWLSNAWFLMVHPYDREAFRRQWASAVGSVTPVETEIRVFHDASRSWRWGHVRAVPLVDPDGQVQEWVGMISDVTARREAEGDRERLGRQLLVAEQVERQRISRILHDDLQQILYGVMLKLRVVRREVQRLAPDSDAAGHLEEAGTWIGRAVEVTRQLTADLNPPTLQDRGLVDALRWLVDQMRTLHGLEVGIEAEEGVAVEWETAQRLFEVARELLFNVAKHAGVQHAEMKLSRAGDQVVLEVTDHGRGFSADRGPGFGLTTIRERLRPLGGRLEIVCRPGAGTHVTVFTPVGAGANHADNQREPR